MKKVFMLSAVMLLVILASCGTPDKTATTEVAPVTSETSTLSDESIAAEVEQPVVLSQGFVEYDESLLGVSDSTILFFHSQSCGSCRQTEENLLETWVTDGTTVLKIDFDAEENFELRKKYGVTTYHTFVQVDADGNEIKKWGGSLTDEDLQEKISTADLAEDTVESVEEELVDESTAAVVEETPVVLASGTYSDYDEGLVGVTENTVVFFHANWCPSCIAAESGITSSDIPEGLTILKADFDASTDLKKKYGVVAQHTFVQIDADGNEIKKWVGGTDADSVVERLK